MKAKDALAFLDELRKIKDWYPTDWEKKFLEDIDWTVRMDMKPSISPFQGKKLKEIYARATEVIVPPEERL